MDFENSVEIKRIKALIGSMTPKERENPDLINPSRKKRISVGSGF
jgi:signal recognition particle subunit SRP54